MLPDADFQAPFEDGFPLPAAPRAEVLPPGGGKYPVPHFKSFASIINLATRTYRYTFDESLLDSTTNSLAIRRDPVVWESLRSRQLPVVQLPWHMECDNDQDIQQAEAVETIGDVIKRIPRLQQLMLHLQEAIYYGRYGVQLVYAWDYSTGRKRLVVRDHKPINGDKLVFRYSGQAGILVHSTFPGRWEVSDRGRVHFFDPAERESLILHRYEPEDSDFFEGELAGAVQGLGLRSRIYWLWYLKNQVFTFLMDYLERVGAGGFTVYFYEAGNPASANEVKNAAEEQYRNNTILFPRYRDAAKDCGPGIQRIEPSQAGAALLQSLVMDYFDETIRRAIGGTRLTREGKGGGLNHGVPDMDAEVEANYVKYDAVSLQETITTDLVSVLQRYMYPELPPLCLRFVFDVDKPNTGEILEAAQAFYEMGGTLDEAEVRSILGLAAPDKGKPMLAKMSPMTPVTGQGIPQGVPFLGQPGPEAASQGGPMNQPGLPPQPPGGGMDVMPGVPPAGGQAQKMQKKSLAFKAESLIRLQRSLIAKVNQRIRLHHRGKPTKLSAGGSHSRVPHRQVMEQPLKFTAKDLREVIAKHFPDHDTSVPDDYDDNTGAFESQESMNRPVQWGPGHERNHPDDPLPWSDDPENTEHAYGLHHDKDREITARWLPKSKSVDLSFGNYDRDTRRPLSKKDLNDTSSSGLAAEKYRQGSLDFAKKIKGFATDLHARKVPISFIADQRRHKAYHKMLTGIGYTKKAAYPYNGSTLKYLYHPGVQPSVPNVDTSTPPPAATPPAGSGEGSSGLATATPSTRMKPSVFPLRKAKKPETPEQREAREAKEAYQQKKISLGQYLKAQPPGHKITVDGKTYLMTMDGPMVLNRIPTKSVTVRPQKYRNPAIVEKYRNQLNVPDSDTEPISVYPSSKQPGSREVFDGHHRLDAYEKAGRSEIPAWEPYS